MATVHVLFRWGLLFATFCVLGGDSGTRARAVGLIRTTDQPAFTPQTHRAACNATQCHLPSVDFKDNILPSHTKTFVAFRRASLIDVENPDRSKILELVPIGEDDPDEMAGRIHEKPRRAELEAFSAWIPSCYRDAELAAKSATSKAEMVGPNKPVEVIRPARSVGLLSHLNKGRVYADGYLRRVRFSGTGWNQAKRRVSSPAEVFSAEGLRTDVLRVANPQPNVCWGGRRAIRTRTHGVRGRDSTVRIWG